MNIPQILICAKIGCPFWSSDRRKSYGCQRWSVSASCHLRRNHPGLDGRNQYALYLSQSEDSDSFLAELKEENDQFFASDPYYLDKVEFLRQNPEFAGEAEMPKRIV